MFTKRAVKREAGHPIGVSAPMYLDCECGERVSLPVIAHMPMTYQCACGIVYDAQGYVVSRPDPDGR